jgi:hypothetical protein
VNSSYLSIHFTVPNFGERFVPADRFYWSYFRDFLYLYIDYTCPISLPVLFSGVLYLYIRCTRTSILPVPILAIFVPVHRYTGPSFLRLLVPVRLLYRSFFLVARARHHQAQQRLACEGSASKICTGSTWAILVLCTDSHS